MLNQLPRDVRILAILQLIPAILGAITCVDQLFLHWFFPNLNSSYTQQIIIGAVGVFLFFELLNLILAYNLAKLRGWAWMTTLILTGLEVLANLFVLYQRHSLGKYSVLLLVIAVVRIYYLLKPNVRRIFRRTLHTI